MQDQTAPNTPCQDARVQLNKTELDVALFPNPTQDEVSIQFKQVIQEDIEIVLYNQFGQQLLRKLNDQQSLRLDVSALVSGVYFVTLKQGEKLLSKKLIISK